MLKLHTSYMRLFLILIFGFTTWLPLEAQRYKIELQNSSVQFVNSVIFPGNIFQAGRLLKCDGEKIRVNAIKQITDTIQNQLYNVMHFRKRHRIVRQLEDGNIRLFDFRHPFEINQRVDLNSNRRIGTSGRLYFSRKGDSVVHVLNRKNFESIFTDAFISSYGDYHKIRKNYLRLHTTDIISMIMVPNLITAVGLQSVGFLIPYTVATVLVTRSSMAGRQKEFQKVRKMVKDFNEQDF